jgi:hypothetical protein
MANMVLVHFHVFNTPSHAVGLLSTVPVLLNFGRVSMRSVHAIWLLVCWHCVIITMDRVDLVPTERHFFLKVIHTLRQARMQ